MATFLVPIPPLKRQNTFQFKPYEGPPNPKRTSRRNSLKEAPSNKGEHAGIGGILGNRPRSDSPQKDKEERHARVPLGGEAIDLTYLAGEDNYGMSDNEGRASSTVGSTNSVSPPNALRIMGSEEIISRQTSRQETGDEGSTQPAPFEGGCQKNAIVIKESTQELDIRDNGFLLEDDRGTEAFDRLEAAGSSNSGRRGGGYSTQLGDAFDFGGVKEDDSEASGLPRLRRERTPKPPTVDVSFNPSICDGGGDKVEPSASPSLAANFEQATEEGGGNGLLRAPRNQPHQPIYKKFKGQVKHPSVLDVSSGSSNNGSDDDTNHANGTPMPTRKRKRMASLHRRLLSSRPLGVSAMQHSVYDDDNGSRDSRVPSNKRRKSGSRSHASKHVEYEVKQIVDVRINGETDLLQYRVSWVGYKHDLTWYNASNFKNSPHKLDDFHKANPTRPGPPKRLRVWLKCWEDTADHSDDDRPQ